MSSLANRTDEAATQAQLAALGNIMDYAIIGGAELKLPTFVYLIRLARMALLEASADVGCIVSVQQPSVRHKSRSSRKERRPTNDEARSRTVKSAPHSDGKETAGIRASMLGRQGPPSLLVDRAPDTHRPAKGTGQ